MAASTVALHSSSHAPGPGAGLVSFARHSVQPEFLRGFIAAGTNILLLFPLNKVISRQAYEGLSWRESIDTVRREGGWYLYRGMAPPLIQRGLSMGVMFGAYDFYTHEIGQVIGSGPQPVHHPETGAYLHMQYDWQVRAAAGLLAGSTEALLAPFERIQTLLQHRRYTEIFKNTWQVTRMLANHGPKEYYRGFTAIILRNGPANACWFSLRDPVKEMIPADPPWRWRAADSAGGAGAGGGGGGDASLSSSQHPVRPTTGHTVWGVFRNFVSGAVLGAGISTLFFPINVVKSVMQLDIGCYHRSALEVGRAVYRERGLAGLYNGVHGNVVRSLLSWGIVNSSYELAKIYLPSREQFS